MALAGLFFVIDIIEEYLSCGIEKKTFLMIVPGAAISHCGVSSWVRVFLPQTAQQHKKRRKDIVVTIKVLWGLLRDSRLCPWNQ